MRHLIRDAVFRSLLAGVFLLLATACGAEQPAPEAHPPEGPPVDADLKRLITELEGGK